MADDVNDLGYAQTPGRMLQAAREEKRLSIDAIAAKLRLSVQRVQELENDDYRNDTEFFIRGHLRNYARIVNISESEILQRFEALGYKKQPTSIASLSLQPASMPHITHTHKIRRLLLWLTAIVMIVFVLLVIIWWQEQDKLSIHVLTKPSLINKNPTTVSQPTTTSIPPSLSQPQLQTQPSVAQETSKQNQSAQNIVANKPESETGIAKPETSIAKPETTIPKTESVMPKTNIEPKNHPLHHAKAQNKKVQNKHVLKANYKIIPVPPNEN